MSLDFSIFLNYNLKMIPIWPGKYNPEEDTTTCLCPRKAYCPSPSKHPMNREWFNTPTPEYTTDVISQIQNSKCNFAIVTGEVPNTNPKLQLVIIDVDVPAMNLPEIKDFPNTLTISTPNNGLHFYYFIPVTEVIHNLSTGYVDVRAGNGYALCPPSKRYQFSHFSTNTITTLQTLPQIPTRSNTSPRNGSKTHQVPFTPYDTYITPDGLVGLGGRDQYVFNQLVTLSNAGHDLQSLLSYADTIYQALEQPPKDRYTLTAIRDKAYYVHERYSDPETIALRTAMDETYPPHTSS